MKSKEAKAFDLALEPSSSRSAYGKSNFGDGCLLARRLVEAGVSFVEVTLGGWGTHQNNFDRVKTLSRTVDPALPTLVSDLKDRGLLDSTLVIWMGEFGRAPRINRPGARPGRDHYPRAWSTVLVGGGTKGGPVIGKTDKEGAAVIERPISALDFMATVCSVLGINYNKQSLRLAPEHRLQAGGRRPVRLLDEPPAAGHQHLCRDFRSRILPRRDQAVDQPRPWWARGNPGSAAATSWCRWGTPSRATTPPS
jgi:hypothetical protein